MPCGARRRSETYELVFFKKTLLFRRERVISTFSSFYRRLLVLQKPMGKIFALNLLEVHEPGA